MIELLRTAAAADGAVAAVVTDVRSWSYAQLLDLAERCATGLRAAGIARFAVVSNDVAVVAALLAAASLVGTEACVYAPDAAFDEVRRQAGTFGHDVVITTRDDLAGAAPTVLGAEQLPRAGAAGERPPAGRPLLVLTTGTTGAPRGVRHDWSRQLERARNARSGTGQVWLLTYGPQQFAGLQVLIHVFSSGATLVAPAVRRPQTVLDAIHANGVDHISATPTFWRFLLAELRADTRPLPHLEQITLGGEAAPASLLEELAATFPSARISHVYAGSEFGSTGSVRDGRGGLPAALLERSGEHGADLKIVDGELWVRSAAAMLGYHGEPDLPAGDWWPTGDLVEVVGDRILFRGRRSEVINVGGAKVHPLPVEERVMTVAGVKAARAYGRPNPLVGAVVAVDVVPAGDIEAGALEAAIRAACAELPRPWQPRSIRMVEELTLRGGKVVRVSEG